MAHGQCCAGCRRAQERPLWGELPGPYLVQTCLVQFCLLLELGGSLQRGWALPKAQNCTELSVTVGTEPTWWVQELWLGIEWDSQAWGYPLAVPKGWEEALLLASLL